MPRPRSFTDQQLQEMIELCSVGFSCVQVAERAAGSVGEVA
jgi:hypothetical protein